MGLLGPVARRLLGPVARRLLGPVIIIIIINEIDIALNMVL